MRTSRWWYGVAGLVLLGLAACGRPAAMPSAPDGANPPASHTGSVVDQPSLIGHLRGAGLMVEVAGDIEQPFFQAKGTLLRISGASLAQPVELQVFTYDAAAAAEADAKQLGPDGSPPTMMITWVAPPHFFRAERVIVLYTGSDQAVLDLLTEVLGPQFAGR